MASLREGHVLVQNPLSDRLGQVPGRDHPRPQAQSLWYMDLSLRGRDVCMVLLSCFPIYVGTCQLRFVTSLAGITWQCEKEHLKMWRTHDRSESMYPGTASLRAHSSKTKPPPTPKAPRWKLLRQEPHTLPGAGAVSGGRRVWICGFAGVDRSASCDVLRGLRKTSKEQLVAGSKMIKHGVYINIYYIHIINIHIIFVVSVLNVFLILILVRKRCRRC